MKSLRDWCKNCFGIKTPRQVIEQDLKFDQLEAIKLEKNIDWDKAQLAYRKLRIQKAEKKLEGMVQ